MATKTKAYQVEAASNSNPDGKVAVTLYSDGSTECGCELWGAQKTCPHVVAALSQWAAEGKFADGKVKLGVGELPPPAPKVNGAPADGELPLGDAAPAAPAAAAAEPSKPAETAAPNGNGTATPTAALAKPAPPNDWTTLPNAQFMQFLERSDVSDAFAALPPDIRGMQQPVIQGLPTPVDWTRILKLAAVWLRSGFVGVDRNGRPTDSVASLSAKLMLGQEYGLTPMESLRYLFSFQGKDGRGNLGMSAAGMLALCYRKIPGFTLKVVQRDNKGSKIVVGRDGQEPAEFEFTMEDATLAGLTENHTYRRYPKRLCWARCVSDMANSYCADALGSTMTLEEAEALEETPTPTPPSTPPTLAATAAAFAPPAAEPAAAAK